MAVTCTFGYCGENAGGVIVIPNQADITVQTAALDLQSFLRSQGWVDMPIYGESEVSLDAASYAERKADLERVHRNVAGGDFAQEGTKILFALDPTAPWLPPDERADAAETFCIQAVDAGFHLRANVPQGLLQAVFWLEAHWNSLEQSLPVVRWARVPIRVGMPYFTEAGAVTDEYLRFMAQSGYNGIYLAFHPYLKYIQDPIFFPISHIFRMRDFVGTEDHAQLTAYVNDVFARAKRYGLDGYLYVMEPWGGDLEFLEAHPEAKGSFRLPKLTSPLCLDVTATREYLAATAAQLAANIPDLDGLIIMNEDGTTICDDTCPNSQGSRSARRAKLFTSIGTGLHQVRDDIRLVAYTWWWDANDFDTVIPALPAGSLVCTRTSTHAPFTLGDDWKGTPQDVSVLVDGPGADFQRAVRAASGRGVRVVDMLTVSNGHELISLPDLPTPDRFAHKVDVVERAGGAGWFTYDCGGVTDNLAAAAMARALWAPAPSGHVLLADLAQSIFGEAGVEEAVAGWRRCSDAMALFPTELDFTDFRAGAGTGSNAGAGIVALLPALPLSVAHAEAYDVSGLGGSLREEFYRQREVMLKYLRPLLTGLEEGLVHLRKAEAAAPPALHAEAQRTVGITEAAACCFRSGIYLLEFLSALDAARGLDDVSAREELAGRVRNIMNSEIENVELLIGAVDRDPRLFYCACTKYFHPMYMSQGFMNLGFFEEGMSIREILQKKVETMRAEDVGSALSAMWSVAEHASP